ncbi:hypothetical protein LINPERHAP2_LOCUS38390 [Linum perenne]
MFLRAWQWEWRILGRCWGISIWFYQPTTDLGGAPFNRARNKSFIDTTIFCGLVDLPFFRPRFTWSRNNVYSRLDRALVNSAWLQSCPDSSVVDLHKLKSDHRPILLRPCFQVYSPNVKLFRFIVAWLSHVSFNFVLSNKWNTSSGLPKALVDLTVDLREWNKLLFGNIANWKKRLTEALQKAEYWVSLNPSE